jgi:hemerythrin-like domain-containing protein
MRFDHDHIIDLLGKTESAADLDSAQRSATQLFTVVHNHFQKEEQVLFRMARQFLSEDELASLGGQWAKRRTPLIGLDVP